MTAISDYLKNIEKAYATGNATAHTHRNVYALYVLASVNRGIRDLEKARKLFGLFFILPIRKITNLSLNKVFLTACIEMKKIEQEATLDINY